MAGYDFRTIEKKWQDYWAENQTFRQPNPGEQGFTEKPKMYVLDMFPYPSGAGLHVGHPEGYTATDIIARFKRMKGFNVLHPMGYDAFGLPAEQYAVEHGVHPRETTAKNIANIERQIKMFGFSYDWSRRVATTDRNYYRWTQWIFLQLFNSWYDEEADAARPISELINKLESGRYLVNPVGQPVPQDNSGISPILGEQVGATRWYELSPQEQAEVIDGQRLAYMAEVPVNWCPKLGTVLANEEVTNEGRSERGNHPVYRRAMRQWMLRITAYADRLLRDVDMLNWPEPIKIMQRNWIGKSVGAEVDFAVVSSSNTGVSPVDSSSNTGVSPVDSFTKTASASSARRPVLTGKGFKGMNPYPKSEDKPDDIIAHIRNLPHVEMPGATYFVTFTAVEGITFTNKERDILLHACLHNHNKQYCLTAVAVMDNHVHMMFRPDKHHTLSAIMHSIKSYTAHEINRMRGTKGSVWSEESFDHIVRNGWWFTKFIYYICDNPVTQKLTDRFDKYQWLWINGDEVVTVPDGIPFGNHYEAAVTDNSHRRDACATESENIITVYTTRPDTLFGATYMVLAPEHPLVAEITTDEHRAAVQDYVNKAIHKSELERTADSKDKTGVFTGAYAINPVNKKQIPIWVADYVMMGYGTGAIMAVPAHDTRDFEFATKFNLPIIQVVQPEEEGVDWRGYVGEGVAVNSGRYDGLTTAEFKKKITEDLDKAGVGRRAVNYKLRDWLFSRQRYWGEPFPIVHCEKCGTVALPEDQLPLELPEMEDFSPAVSEDPEAPPAPPLGKMTDWVNTKCPACGGPARRELNTMPQWAGSCWYYLRYLNPDNNERFVDPQIEQYWMAGSETNPIGGVDLYVGGAEHAVLHLLYARFWHKVLFDLGHVSTPEPFARLFNQGMIRSFAYRDRRGVCVEYHDVDVSGDKPRHKRTGEELTESVEKMSKSLKNVVNPDEVIEQYGADTFRLYEMFMGPLEASKPWNTRDVPGVHRFLHRIWRMILGSDDQPALLADKSDESVEKALHKLIRKVGEDIEAMKFNTAIAAMMEFVNLVYKTEAISVSQAERFVLLLAPFAPHMAEELWRQLGHGGSLSHEAWPDHDEAVAADDMVEVPVQICGRVRARISVPADASQEDCIAAAKADRRIAELIAGKTIVKEIVVPGRLVNIVVK